jgi:5'-deoxynucleotidase YfbR-like HD superfamily hydrolase
MESMFERIGKPADIFQQLMFVLQGGSVRRFHTVATVKDITVATHQHNVAHLCFLLTGIYVCTTRLLMAALSHDLAETVAGDIPSPTKRLLRVDQMLNTLEKSVLKDNGYEFELTEQERRILKLADLMAGMLECIHERQLGNRNVELPFLRFDNYIRNLLSAHCTDHEQAVFQGLQKLWVEATINV